MLCAKVIALKLGLLDAYATRAHQLVDKIAAALTVRWAADRKRGPVIAFRRFGGHGHRRDIQRDVGFMYRRQQQ
jgi:hypothetical protein